MKQLIIALLLLTSQFLKAEAPLRTPSIPPACLNYEQGNIDLALTCVQQMHWSTSFEEIENYVAAGVLGGGIVGGFVGLTFIPSTSGSWGWASVGKTFSDLFLYTGTGVVVGAVLGGGVIYFLLVNSSADSTLQAYYTTNEGFQEFLKLDHEKQRIFIRDFQPSVLIELINKIAAEAKAQLQVQSHK